MEKINSKINQYFQKRCPKHDMYELNIVLIQKQVKDHIVCLKCVQEEKIPYQQFMHIIEASNISDERILHNFPPLEDETLSIFLNNYSSKQNQTSQLIEKINNYFDSLKQEMLSIIDQKQNETKLKISTLSHLQEQIIDTYNTISSKSDLSNIVNSSEKDEEIHQKIQQIIDDKYNNITTNTEKIKEKIDNYKLLEDSINVDEPVKIQSVIKDFLNKIDFFSQINLQIFDENAQNINIQDSNQSLKTNNVDIILQLIKNPTNFCSQQYLSQTESILKRFQHIFNSIEIEDIMYDIEKQKIFSNLSLEQIENIKELSQKIQNIQQNQNQNNQIFQDTQKNSSVITLELSKLNIIDDNKLITLLKKYPIFDMIEQIQYNLIKSINLIKSSVNNSQNQQISRINNDYIQIKKQGQNNQGGGIFAANNNYNGGNLFGGAHNLFGGNNYNNYNNVVSNAVSYADFILDPKMKYIFRIQIQSNSQEDTQINVGLINEQDKDYSLISNNGLSYIERGDYQGISKVIKGGNVHEGRKQNINKEIEMRINLENKILKVANYPNYENVAEICDKNKIDESQKYRFATELYYQEHTIIITHFEIVYEFDNKM